MADSYKSQQKIEDRNSNKTLIYKSPAINEVSVTQTPRSKVAKNLNTLFDKISNEIAAKSQAFIQNSTTSPDIICTANQVIVSEFDNNNSLEDINNCDQSESVLNSQESPAIYDITVNDVITSAPINAIDLKGDPSQSAGSNTVLGHDVESLQYVESVSKISDSDHLSKEFSPSVLNVQVLEDMPVPNESDHVSPKPSTSTCENTLLHQDLYLSDDEISPYIDSESSYTPSPSKPRHLPLSLDSDLTDVSDSVEATKENQPKRKKKAMPEAWKRNVLKKLRQTGKGYTSRNGKFMEPKECKPTDCSKCRYQCNSSFPENLRQDIFEEYWSLGDTKQQKMMLSSLISHAEVLRLYTKAKKNRTMSRQYWLFHQSVGKKRVCQNFFCNTFKISSSIINNCSKNRGLNGIFMGTDKRIGKMPANITSVESTNYVKEHINLYPRVESHYCRKSSKKQYLDSDLNLSRLYQMYKDFFCPEKMITPVSPYVYQKIFHSYNPRLAFYKPKKDQCTKCNVYKRSDNRAPLQEDYDAHKKRENDALTMKKEDKERCLNSGGAFRAITFDLQAILSVPFTGDCKIYYLRKLSMYNFTILDCHANTGYCYLWDECNGKKGSTEIGSILLKYLSSLPETVTHVASFSDTCGGQNRNKYVTLAALYAVNNIPHLDTIDLKFMESGHSYLEVDSIHACIERARKHKSIFTLREYALVIGSARIKPKPYDVIIMKHGEFYDLKGFEKTLNSNTTKNTKNEPVQWLKIKWLRLQKESPTSILYKYDLSDPDFKEIDICKTKTMKKNKDICISKLKKPLKGAYKSLIAVSQTKKKDLITLLNDGVIPPEYEHYYKDIPSTSAAIVNNNCDDTESSDDDPDEESIVEEI